MGFFPLSERPLSSQAQRKKRKDTVKSNNFIRLVLGVLNSSQWDTALWHSDQTFPSKVWNCGVIREKTELLCTARCYAIAFVHRVKVEMAWKNIIEAGLWSRCSWLENQDEESPAIKCIRHGNGMIL